MKKYFLIIVILAFGCTRNPITKRTSLHLISDKKLQSSSDKSYKKYIAKSKISTDSINAEMVKKVGKRLSSVVETYLRSRHRGEEANQFKWEFNLVQDSLVNAWCMPGGKVVVYSGILPVTQDENGMAVVLGHEISHAVAKHSNRTLSQKKLLQVGGLALQIVTLGKSSLIQGLTSTAYNAGTSVGLLLPFNRKDEYEADRMGMIFMAMAGYDPHNAISFWQRMDAKTKDSQRKQYLSTHPGHANRISKLKEELPEAMKYYKKK
jgi:predicted Zn-dependent protease